MCTNFSFFFSKRYKKNKKKTKETFTVVPNDQPTTRHCLRLQTNTVSDNTCIITRDERLMNDVSPKHYNHCFFVMKFKFQHFNK
jgi:hypothetical protein